MFDCLRDPSGSVGLNLLTVSSLKFNFQFTTAIKKLLLS